MMLLHETIKQLRLEKGYTQIELSKLLDVSPSAVNKWEKGISYPDILHLLPLANILGVSVDTLLRGVTNCSDEQLREYTEHISTVLDQSSFTDALKTAKGYMNSYPNDIRLNCTLLIILLYSQFGKESTDIDWMTQRLKLMIQRDTDSNNNQYIEALVRYYSSINNLKSAKEILEFLPKELQTYKLLLAEIYFKEKNYTNAYRLSEEVIYSSYMLVDTALNSLKKIANTEKNKELFDYYRNKQVQCNTMFELGEYSNLVVKLDTPDQLTYQDMLELLHAVPTLGSFTKSKLYAHMNFNDFDHSLHIRVYQELLEEIKVNEDFNEKEIKELSDYINTQLESLTNKS